MSAWEFLKELTNPESIINYGGTALLFFVVFAETGLLLGFFLPGDSLLFTAGLLCGTGIFHTSIDMLLLGLCISGITGNVAGYWFGKKIGGRLFMKNDSLIFKKKYVTMTSDFYKRHGGKTLILGRFLPIIRTFAPILAGVIKIDFKKFMLYNIVGCVAWVASLTLIGYFLGKEYPQVKDYLEYIILFLIVITSIPVVITYRKEQESSKSYKQ